MTSARILSLNDKLKIVATDIFDKVILGKSPVIERYVPTKQVRNVLSDEEVMQFLWLLRKSKYINFYYGSASGLCIDHLEDPSRFSPQDVFINGSAMRKLLGLKPKPPSGVALDRVRAVLYINGSVIKLGRGEGERSLQYWVCVLCLSKPNKPIEEVKILSKAKPETEYELTARSRAIRDAVKKLNDKIEAKTGFNKVFIFSRATVTYDARKIHNQ